MSDDTEPHPSGLHLHGFQLHEGHLGVELATGGGRCLHLELDPDDHPLLSQRFQDFSKALIAASETALLDIMGLHAVMPDDTTSLERHAACYICGVVVITTEPPTSKAYCENHKYLEGHPL